MYSQDEVYDVTKFVNDTNRRFAYLELGFNRVFQPLKTNELECYRLSSLFSPPDPVKHNLLQGPNQPNSYGYQWIEYIDRERFTKDLRGY